MDTIERCMRDYGKDIYSFCVYLTGNKDTADDLYQQTFLTAIEKGGIDSGMNPKSYLLSIAVNVRNNQRRKAFWRRQIADVVYMDDTESADIADDSGSALDMAVSREQRDAVRKAVMTLPEKLRCVVIMFYMEDMQISEIAQTTGLSEGTVKSRLHNAKKKLRERLADYE